MSSKLKTIPEDPFALIEMLRQDGRTIATIPTHEWSTILDQIFPVITPPPTDEEQK
jgi:hypothetical protein